MQAECRGNCDLGNVEGKTWHALMLRLKTMKMTREWRPLLLLRPRLVDHRGHIQGSGGVGLVVRKGVIGPIQEFQGACECSEGDSGG